MSFYSSVRNGGRSSSGGEASYTVYPPPNYPPGYVPGTGHVSQPDVPLSKIVPGRDLAVVPYSSRSPP